MNRLLPISEDNFDKVARIALDTHERVVALEKVKALLILIAIEIPVMAVII